MFLRYYDRLVLNLRLGTSFQFSHSFEKIIKLDFISMARLKAFHFVFSMSPKFESKNFLKFLNPQLINSRVWKFVFKFDFLGLNFIFCD